ncbi:MAG: crotonase/enoyl-CoA hydratase family protein [Alphaproteobacteria bacterium]|nr:crotonase/enoyl-CoA hydratase family protein [Alphaproteobacteria bacterium]
MKVLTEREGPIVIVTINRPESRNAVDGETAAALFAALKDAEADDGVSVTILTGAGGYFCAGADLKSVGRGDRWRPAAWGAGPLGPTRLVADRAQAEPGVTLSKPLIAAVEGHAVAGGLELALLADMRVASETAVFGVFCRRWGVPLIDGGTVRLPRIIGQGRAMDMILTGRPVDAREAYDWGLANRLVPQGQALAAAKSLVADISRFPQQCMRADRASAYAGWSRAMHEALMLEGLKGAPIVEAEGVAGAARFASGAGRGGSFES